MSSVHNDDFVPNINAHNIMPMVLYFHFYVNMWEILVLKSSHVII